MTEMICLALGRLAASACMHAATIWAMASGHCSGTLQQASSKAIHLSGVDGTQNHLASGHTRPRLPPKQVCTGVQALEA